MLGRFLLAGLVCTAGLTSGGACAKRPVAPVIVSQRTTVRDDPQQDRKAADRMRAAIERLRKRGSGAARVPRSTPGADQRKPVGTRGGDETTGSSPGDEMKPVGSLGQHPPGGGPPPTSSGDPSTATSEANWPAGIAAALIGAGALIAAAAIAIWWRTRRRYPTET